MGLVVTEFRQVRILDVFPAVLEFFEHTTAALGETGITNLAVIHHHLATSGSNRLADNVCRCTGDALITLAMVIGTDIETGMVFTVVPTDHLILSLSESRIFCLGLSDFLILLDLCQQPSSGNNRMSLQEFQRSSRTHFRRNHTCQVVFHVDDIDSCQLTIFYNDFQGTQEALVFLAFPMEVDTDGHIVQFECVGNFVHGLEYQFIVKIALPINFTVFIGYRLLTTNFFTAETIRIQQYEADLRFKHDSYMYFRFFHGKRPYICS